MRRVRRYFFAGGARRFPSTWPSGAQLQKPRGADADAAAAADVGAELVKEVAGVAF